MGVPTPQELEQALTTAATMREQDNDPDFIAKSLLNLNYQHHLLEGVLQLSKLYLHSGQGGYEHTQLLKAIEETEQGAAPTTDRDDFGLDMP